MTYQIGHYRRFAGLCFRTIISETPNAAKAYELAHSLDAEVHCGKDEDSLVPDSNRELTIFIEDEDRNDQWHWCCEARCPSERLLL